jgi:hypothetical protein
MVLSLHHRQARNYFWSRRRRQSGPPGAFGRAAIQPHQTQVTAGESDRVDDTGDTFVRDERNRKPKMETSGITHTGIAAGEVRMN